MKKLKILQFPIANSNGGITHYALNNWKYMDTDKFQCDFATMSKKLDFEDDILKTGSKVYYISCYAEQNETQFRKEINEILEEGYDIVHLHTKQWKSYIVEEICRENHVPKVIVHSHSTRCDNNDDEIRKKETEQHYRVRESLTEDIATDFWACSTEASDWLYGDKIPKERIVIMPNAIETERFAYREEWRKCIRDELQISEDRIVIGNVGRMVYQKNQDFLLDAFASAIKVNDKLVLVIVGDGLNFGKLQNQARELGIYDRVYFLGYRADTNKIYSAMDAFALPSRFEGLPISAVEAQTAGLPVFCTDNISREVNISGCVEFISLNIEKWSEKFSNLKIIDENQLDRMNKKYDVQKAGFDLKNQVKVIEKAYLDL